MRDRGARKGYAEPSSSDDEFDDRDSDDDDNDDNDDNDDEEEEDKDEHQVEEILDDNDEVVVQTRPLTRTITLKIKTGMWQQMSQGSEPAGSNGGKHNGDSEDQDAVADDVEDKDAVADDEPDADLEAEVQDLQEEVKIVFDDDDDDDDDEGPRRPTRRVTRQSLESNKKESESSRPNHGRKGIARQRRSSDKANGDKASSPEGRRSSMRSRLRKQMHRSSREDKKKKHQVSESEFEDEGVDDPADDDISMASDRHGIIDDGDSEEDYSSAPRRHVRKPPPRSRAKSRRSRNVSDDGSGEDEDLIEELRDIGAELPPRQRQLRPTERMNYFIPPPPDKDDVFLAGPTSNKKRSGTGRGFGGFGGFGGDFSNMGLGDRFRGITGLGTAGGADDSSDSVPSNLHPG